MKQMKQKKILFYQRENIVRQRLLEFINKLILHSKIPRNKSQYEVSQYKFYTFLVLKLIRYNREYGVPMREILLELKAGLIQDDKLEKRIVQDSLQAVLEFAFFALVIWIFIATSLSLLKIKIITSDHESFLSYSFFAGVLIWHLAGGIIFTYFFSYLHHLINKFFTPYAYALYAFPSLIKMGIPLQQAYRESNLQQFFSQNDAAKIMNMNMSMKKESKRFSISALIFNYFVSPGRLTDLSFIKQRFFKLICHLQSQGGGIEEEFMQMRQDLWFLLHESYEDMIKKIKPIKILFLMIFYLSTYFFYLYILTQQSLQSLPGSSTF